MKSNCSSAVGNYESNFISVIAQDIDSYADIREFGERVSRSRDVIASGQGESIKQDSVLLESEDSAFPAVTVGIGQCQGVSGIGANRAGLARTESSEDYT